MRFYETAILNQECAFRMFGNGPVIDFYTHQGLHTFNVSFGTDSNLLPGLFIFFYHTVGDGVRQLCEFSPGWRSDLSEPGRAEMFVEGSEKAFT